MAMSGMLAARAAGAVSLFNGRDFAGWTLGGGAEVTHSWNIEDGAIATLAGTRGRSDLLCTKPLQSFDLQFEFRLSQGSNTGVKYFVRHMLRYLYPGASLAGSYGAIGLEFQLADNSSPDVADPEQKLGALYGILPVQQSPQYAVGEWARARLVCRKSGCEHWINDQRVLAYDPLSEDLRRRFRQAATNPEHSIVGAAAAQVAARRTGAEIPPCFIALQQHDSKAWFRGLLVRELND